MALHLGQHRCSQQDRIRLLADGPRHRHQNPMNLALLFVQQPHQLVVLFDGLQRLNKHRLPRRRRPMNHPRHTLAKLRLHWNHEPLAAHRNQLLLCRSLAGQRAQRLPQALFNRPVLPLHRAPDAPQLVARVVGDRSVRLDLSPQRVQQRRKVVLHQCRR